MTHAEQATSIQRGFHLELPEGFVELPLADIDFDSSDFTALTTVFAERLGLRASDEESIAAASTFAQLGSTIGAGGIDYAAIAFFKSPDDALRPIMISLTGIAIPSDHRSTGEAIRGLIDIHSASGPDAVEEIQLPAGRAVAVVKEDRNTLTVGGEPPAHILTRELAAWIPDPEGTTIGVTSVITNSFQDWERVCVLALDIFDTFGWEPLGD